MKEMYEVPASTMGSKFTRRLFLIFGLILLAGTQGVFANKTTDEESTHRKEVLQTENVLFQGEKVTVTGRVLDPSGYPVPGVNVLEVGTNTGVVTDAEGNYTISVAPQSSLRFTFIGFKVQTIQVGSRRQINVELVDEFVGLDEIVVVAMGVRAEKKKLNFAVQSLDADELTSGKQTNFVNALQGRIAGVEISGTGGSPSASSQMVIRGISSINGAQINEPIFILNGMQVSGGASKAAELNPNDIENITVLKGAAAAALYGMDAANGAIIVTTKSGSGTDGEVNVRFGSTVQLDQPYRTPEIQNQYLRGAYGVYREESMGGFGPLAPEGTKTYDNVNNFFQTGVYQKYDLSISGGTKKFNTYASFTYSDHSGIVPNDYLDRWGGLLKSNYMPSDNLTISLMLNVVDRKSRGFGASMGSVYNWAIDDDITNYKNPDGSIRRPYLNTSNIRNSPISPLWGRYEDTGLSESTRTLLQSTVTWDITSGLSVTGRIGYDFTNSDSHSVTTPRFTFDELNITTNPTPEDMPYLGSYFYNDGKSSVMNTGAMANYTLKLTPDITMDALLGFDAKTEKGRSIGMGGRQFIVDEWESINNLEDIRKENITMGRTEKNVYGYYGELKFDYRGLAQVGATYRNDASSTLPKDNRKFDYFSYSGGIVFSELFDIRSSLFNYGKLQGNWAKVGKDAPLYRLNQWFRTLPLPDNGYGVDPTRSINQHLLPEMTTSWEIGLDTRFFNERTKLEFAYYSTKVDNQIVEVRVSPSAGSILQTKNEGTVTNKGFEFIWTQNILRERAVKWDITTNFSLNRGKLIDLPDDIIEVYHHEGRHGNIAGVAYLGGSTMALSGTDYERTENGEIIVNANGTPRINASPSLLIGNREADFSIGISNRLNYKKWSLDMMVNIRKGGDVANITQRSLMGNGQAKIWEDYRNREVLVKGVVKQADGSYLPNTTPVVYDQTFHRNYVETVGSNFLEDGSFIRLGYVTLGYDLSKYVAHTLIKGLNFSVTGKNLLLFTKYTGSDPVVNYTGTSRGTGTSGIDYNNQPATRSVSFSLNANF